MASSGNAPQQNQAKHDEKVKLKAYTECSDLHAQWAMADVTFWAFGAGLAGIGLVFMTWLATRQGAQQQWISSRNGTRAYVHADTARFTNFNTPSVHVNISNTGTTPAKWFEVASYSCVYENHSSITELIDFSNLGEFAKWSGLASGMKLLAPTASINETTNVRMAMNSANKGFLVYGVIRYCTIFDETYETQFAFIAKNPSPSIMRIGDRENISYLNRPSVMLEVYKEA